MVGYLVIVATAAYFFRKVIGKTTQSMRLAVVIPAHNEEGQVSTVIKSILRSNYPNNLLTVLVIADNCTDATAKRAAEAGAVVFSRQDDANRGKGQALDWFLREHVDRYQHAQGLVVIDADTIVDGDFFIHIAESLSVPEVKVVQGFYKGSNSLDNWRTALNSAAWNVFNNLRLAGANQLGGTAILKGNGMAFDTKIIRQYGWPAYSVVEDVEFSLMLLRDDVLVHFNPDAVVFGEMAGDRKQAEVQRQRWDGGRWLLFKRYVPALIKDLLVRPRLSRLHALVDLVVPPLSLLVVMVLMVTVGVYLFVPLLVQVAWLLWLGLVYYVLSGQVTAKAPLKIWLYLFTAPLFVIWKILLYLRIVIGKKDVQGWQRTVRKSELSDKNK
ncbi:MAG: glycosyltransferase family 2 protein [Desulfobulbaceae bacterium]|nr:glycosyltransferase family 2 protein [Desulfobulbaceae bacterium]